MDKQETESAPQTDLDKGFETTSDFIGEMQDVPKDDEKEEEEEEEEDTECELDAMYY